MKEPIKSIVTSGTNESANDSALSSTQNNASTQISSALEGRTVFPTLSTEAEIHALQHGKIPAEVIYSGEAGRKLSAIDHNRMHPYSLLVNNGIINMFLQLWSDLQYKENKLRECLGKTNTWIDVGTWNGIVSNMIAFPIFNQLVAARMNRELKMLKTKDFDNLPHHEGKPRFISCDLSKASLWLAEDLAKYTFHDLEKLFDLEHHHETFQQLLANDKTESPRVITMFNVLANFSYEDLEKILKDVFASMRPWDVFIPSFFVMQNMNNSVQPYNIPFWYLTRELYANKETRDWCVSAFANRYKINKGDIWFNVDRKNDGREYIDVSLSIPQNTTLHVPTDSEKDANLKAPNSTFEVFKSYRMPKEAIKKLYTSIWFQSDYLLEDREWINVAPVLYKP